MGIFDKRLPCPKCHNSIVVGQETQITCDSCNEELFVKDADRLLTTGMLEKQKIEEQISDQERSALRARSEARIASAKEHSDYSELTTAEVDVVASEIILTTSVFVANREIAKEIEVISAECVYGMHIFKDLFAGVRDIFGGRSRAIQDTLRDARKTALAELRREALMVGADAVIGVDLDYHEISSGGKGGMIMLVASGTAVKLKK